jgi:hypothetical protein
MNWRLIAFEMGLLWNEPLRSKNARRANVQARMSYGRMHFVRMLRECLRRESKTILFTKHQLSSSVSNTEDELKIDN